MRSILGLIVAFITFGIDFFSKNFLIETLLNPVPTEIDILPVLKFEPVWNPGVSFGFFRDLGIHSPLPFIIVAMLIVMGLVVWTLKTQRVYLHIALGLIMGGAVGNILDRLRFDAVFDFIKFYYGTFVWPNFNIADAAIVIGCFLLIIDGVFNKKGDS